MKFDDIKVGKKYYRLVVTSKPSRGRENNKTLYSMLVTNKDDKTFKVEAVSLSSSGTTPPTWFGVSGWGKWMKHKPEHHDRKAEM